MSKKYYDKNDKKKWGEKMKKLLVLAIAVMLLLSLSTSALASQNEVSIVIDNQKVQFTNDSGKPFWILTAERKFHYVLSWNSMVVMLSGME